MMKARDYRKQMEKRRWQVYGGERDYVDVLLYLLHWREAEEDDVERQLNRAETNDEAKDD